MSIHAKPNEIVSASFEHTAGTVSSQIPLSSAQSKSNQIHQKPASSQTTRFDAETNLVPDKNTAVQKRRKKKPVSAQTNVANADKASNQLQGIDHVEGCRTDRSRRLKPETKDIPMNGKSVGTSAGAQSVTQEVRKSRKRTSGKAIVEAVPRHTPSQAASQSSVNYTTQASGNALFQSYVDPFPSGDYKAESHHAADRNILLDRPRQSSSHNSQDQQQISATRQRELRLVGESREQNIDLAPVRKGNRRSGKTQRSQLPDFLTKDHSHISRGAHGRLQFAPKSVNPIVVSSDAPKELVQRQQYTQGTGIQEQVYHNLQGDRHLLKQQKHNDNELADTKDVLANSDSSRKRDVAEQDTLQHKKVKSPYFTEYVSKDTAVAGLATKDFFSGTLRINQKARRDAWVTISDKDFSRGDVLIAGERARNRALNGDEVVIELIDTDEDDALAHTLGGLCIADKRAPTDHQGRACGRVVFVLSTRPLQRIAGLIRPPGWEINVKQQDERALLANASKRTSCQFHPQDVRIPFMTISQHDLPKSMQGQNWIFNILQKQKTIFAARIVRWGHESRFPRGTIVDELGAVGNIEAETAAILADCDVDVRNHPASALTCLPEVPWSISAEEISKRRDFRSDRVCTIDPETARDLDDALSVRDLGDDVYEIGVHIADVSHFVQQGNALDAIARERATTVYMVQKAIPMLPRLLCEELCSLNPAVDRLAFSVTWQMNASGEEVGPRWYGRSVIRSAVRFAYGEAQNLLDGKSWEEGVGKPIDGGHTIEEITRDIKLLHGMSRAMRRKRFDNGALTINAFKLNFRLNSSGLPGVAEVYELKDANRLIEEFMLKANISVAERIVGQFPKHSLLRMHPQPKDRPLQEFVKYAEKLGIAIDTSSSATLQQGFNDLAVMAKDNPMVAVLQNNAVRSMRRAEYICTGVHDDRESWAHYALAVPLYTHFTSPIRRYADVIVHRLLARALSQEGAGFEAEDCESWAKNCNVRKENARAAQDRSSTLYLCAYIEETCRKTNRMGTDEGMHVPAIVVAVRDRSIDVIVPQMALERRIYYDDSYSIKSFEHNESKETTTIWWNSMEERVSAIQDFENAEDAVKESQTPKRNQDKNVKEKTRQKLIAVPPSLNGRNSPRLEDDQVMSADNTKDHATEKEGHSKKTGGSELAVMDKIHIWLRGDFSVSPCDVLSGFVHPSLVSPLPRS